MQQPAALQIRVGQRSTAASLQPLTAHIYHIMIIVTGGFFKKYFFINTIFISQKFLGTILKLFSCLQNTKNNSAFFLSVHFLLVFFNRSVYLRSPTFHTFPPRVNIEDLIVCSLFYCSFAITLCNNDNDFQFDKITFQHWQMPNVEQLFYQTEKSNH